MWSDQYIAGIPSRGQLRRNIAWLRAYDEALREQRPLSILRTHYQLKGWLI